MIKIERRIEMREKKGRKRNNIKKGRGEGWQEKKGSRKGVG